MDRLETMEHFSRLMALKVQESPVTTVGVISGNAIDGMWDNDYIDLAYENARKEAYEDKLRELCGNQDPDDIHPDDLAEYKAETEEYVNNLDLDVEGTTQLYGSWKKDENGQYEPDLNGEYAAIYDSNDNIIQVVWSKNIFKACRRCSPCYPGQGDLDADGFDYLCYCLPLDCLSEAWVLAHTDYILAPEDSEGRLLLASKPYSNHPDDWYLKTVLARVNKGTFFEYVTWEINTCDQKKHPSAPFYGAHWGHYHADIKAAASDYASRFYDCYKKND
jgi:hypothetical protein